MSIAQMPSDANCTAQQLSSCVDGSHYQRRVDVKIADMTPDDLRQVLYRALRVSSDIESHLCRVIENGTVFSLEFVTTENRNEALEKLKEYAQLPHASVPSNGSDQEHGGKVPQASAIDCVEWMRSGQKTCPAGSTCPFRHAPLGARVPCRHWVRNRGECWYGHRCGFLHPAHALSPANKTHDVSAGVGSGGKATEGKLGDGTSAAAAKSDDDSSKLAGSRSKSMSSSTRSDGDVSTSSHAVSEAVSIPSPQPKHRATAHMVGADFSPSPRTQSAPGMFRQPSNPWAMTSTSPPAETHQATSPSTFMSAIPTASPSSPREKRRAGSAVVGSPWLARAAMANAASRSNEGGRGSGQHARSRDGSDECGVQFGRTASFDSMPFAPLSTSFSSVDDEIVGPHPPSMPSSLGSGYDQQLHDADVIGRFSSSNDLFPLSTSVGSLDDETGNSGGSDTSVGSIDSSPWTGLATSFPCGKCTRLATELEDTAQKLKGITSLNAELARSVREKDQRVKELEDMLRAKNAELCALKAL